MHITSKDVLEARSGTSCCYRDGRDSVGNRVGEKTFFNVLENGAPNALLTFPRGAGNV